MDKRFYHEKAFWQKYTDEEISDQDVLEIEKNLRDFARTLIEISRKHNGGKKND